MRLAVTGSSGAEQPDESMGPLAAINIRNSPDHLEDDLDFPPEAEEPAGQVMMHKPVAVRPPANTQWQLTSKDARKANEREKTATGEQTPRFAAARRDFYERAERQSESIVYASSDDGSHPHQLDSILSWQETASGSTSAANTSVSTPMSNFSPSNPSHAPIPFTRQPMHRAPMRPAALAPEASFKHAQNSRFQPVPPMRRKNKGNGGRENPSNSVSNRGKSFETPKAARTVHGTPNKRNPPSSNKGQKLVQWDKDYSKMLDQIKNMNIDELRVVELGGGSSTKKNDDKSRTTISIPLNVTAYAGNSRPKRDNEFLAPGANTGGDEDDADLPAGWRRLESRSTGLTYYGNVFTGESMWTRPTTGDTLSSSAEQVAGVVDPSRREQVVHDGPSASSSITSFWMPEAMQPALSNSTQHDHRRQGECSDDNDTVHNDTMVSLPNNPAAQSQYDAIISVDPRYEDKDDHVGEDMRAKSSESLAIAAHPPSWEPPGPPVEQVSTTALERTASMLHLIVSLAFFVATCALLGLQARWIHEDKTPEGQRCSAGPPLLEWAVAMSGGLVFFATLIHVSLIRRDRVFSGGGKVHAGRLKWVLLTIFFANLILFVLGQVWTFSTYPGAGVGCTTSWTLPNIEYATASFLIICIYLGYSVAAATLMIGRATEVRAVSLFPKFRSSDSPPESDRGIGREAHPNIQTLPVVIPRISAPPSGETVDGHLVFDDNTPTPRVVHCHHQPTVSAKPLSVSASESPKSPSSVVASDNTAPMHLAAGWAAPV